MPALELEEVQPDVSVRELEARWGISRNALKARARALGVQLIPKGPNLTVWPGDRVGDGDRLDAHCKAGGAMATFPGVSQPAVTPQGRSDGSQLAVTASKAGQLEALAAAMAAAMPTPPVDPLRRARGLAEVADAGLVLTNGDLEELLGQGVSSWRNGHQAYGYGFRRHQQGRQILWTVERMIRPSSAMPALAPAPATPEPKRAPGFVACLTPAIEAQATVLSRVELPSW